jgi:hypothetical protein
MEKSVKWFSNKDAAIYKLKSANPSFENQKLGGNKMIH